MRRCFVLIIVLFALGVRAAEPTCSTLPNGVRLITAPCTASPLVSVEVLLDASAFDERIPREWLPEESVGRLDTKRGPARARAAQCIAYEYAGGIDHLRWRHTQPDLAAVGGVLRGACNRMPSNSAPPCRRTRCRPD